MYIRVCVVKMPEENKKRIFYAGFPGDQGTPYEQWGISINPRTVYPVSEDLFQVLKNIRGFHTVDEVKTGLIDFPPSFTEPKYTGSVEAEFSGDFIASLQNSMSTM